MNSAIDKDVVDVVDDEVAAFIFNLPEDDVNGRRVNADEEDVITIIMIINIKTMTDDDDDTKG